jgi:hypothetical protein
MTPETDGHHITGCNMTSQSTSDNERLPPRHVSKLSVALLVMTTLAALMALALLWATQWVVVNIAADSNSTIDNARRAALATPLFWAGVTMFAALWILLWRWLRWRHIAILIAVTLIAATFTGLFGWRSQIVDQPVSVTTYHCAPGGNPFEDDHNILENCVTGSAGSQLTLGSFDDRDAYAPETTSGAAARFTGLPVGTYDGYMTSTAPIETASILLATETDDGIRPLRLFGLDDPFGDEARTWSAPVRLNPGTSSYLLLYYISPEPAVPEARIIFNLRQCASTSPTAFDPAGCKPMAADDWILRDVTSGTDPATSREPIRTRDEDTVTYTNLEARTWRFTPNPGNQAITASGYGFLVIPTDGPQTADANILALSPESRQEEFSVEITPDSGTIAFTIYIFPSQNIYATTPTHEHIATIPGAILTP